MHIVHLTSAHPRYDIRIFKECRSLVKEHKGFFVVTDGKGMRQKKVFIYMMLVRQK